MIAAILPLLISNVPQIISFNNSCPSRKVHKEGETNSGTELQLYIRAKYWAFTFKLIANAQHLTLIYSCNSVPELVSPSLCIFLALYNRREAI